MSGIANGPEKSQAGGVEVLTFTVVAKKDKLTHQQWSEFKDKLKAVATHFGLEFKQ